MRTEDTLELTLHSVRMLIATSCLVFGWKKQKQKNFDRTRRGDSHNAQTTPTRRPTLIGRRHKRVVFMSCFLNCEHFTVLIDDDSKKVSVNSNLPKNNYSTVFALCPEIWTFLAKRLWNIHCIFRTFLIYFFQEL